MTKSLSVLQPSFFRGRFLIMDGDKTLAEMTTRGIFRMKAKVSIGGQSWDFTQKGIISTATVITSNDPQRQPIIFYARHLKTPNTITIGDKTYRLKLEVDKGPGARLFKPRLNCWYDQHDREQCVVHFDNYAKFQGSVLLTDKTMPQEDCLMLTLLGIFKAMKDSSVASVG
jgi:hypothetical protein